MIGEQGRADAGAFLVRLVRLDPMALVRIRPIRPGWAELWGRLPFDVLVVRAVVGTTAQDTTVGAADLLASVADPAAALPERRDAAWRWPLPPSRGRVVERLPVSEVAGLAAAASRTVRAAAERGVGGRAVGERVVRDALLGHTAIVVTGPAGYRVEVPQRLVQAVSRMGFLGHPSVPGSDIVHTNSERDVTVRTSARWIGLAAPYGSAWYLPASPLRLT